MTQTSGHSWRERLAAIGRVVRLSGHTARSRALSRSVRRMISARSRKLSAAYPIDSSSTPLTNRWETRSSGSRSPEPLSSCTHISASGSSAAPQASTRTAAVLPWRGMEPSSQLWYTSGTLTVRPRTSVPNGTGWKMSPGPPRSSGHGACRALLTSCRPTHSSSRPACSEVTGSGHAAPSGRRSPEASCSRRSVTIAAVTP
jgi:hypothetical protein